MRLAMLGTGPFAAPTFAALLASRHEVAGLVTQPPREEQGRKKAAASPCRVLAEGRGLPILAPASINTPEARGELADWRPELLVVCDYGQILSPETLALARLGGVNLHGSLLPRYRGAAPVNWALYHGDAETGVTVIHMTPRLDAGPALAVGRLAIDPDETAPELEARLAQLGAPLVLETIDRLERGEARPAPQRDAQATRARRLRKSDGAIDWSRSALEIKNQIRALEPWPRAFTYWRRAGAAPLRLIPGAVDVVDEPSDEPCGTVTAAAGPRLVVAAGRGQVAWRAAQPEGKRRLSIEELLRGYPVRVGDRFGPPPEPSA